MGSELAFIDIWEVSWTLPSSRSRRLEASELAHSSLCYLPILGTSSNTTEKSARKSSCLLCLQTLRFIRDIAAIGAGDVGPHLSLCVCCGQKTLGDGSSKRSTTVHSRPLGISHGRSPPQRWDSLGGLWKFDWLPSGERSARQGDRQHGHCWDHGSLLCVALMVASYSEFCGVRMTPKSTIVSLQCVIEWICLVQPLRKDRELCFRRPCGNA